MDDKMVKQFQIYLIFYMDNILKENLKTERL